MSRHSTSGRRCRPRLARLPLILALFLAPPLAQAYTYRTCDGKPITWRNGTATMYINSTQFTGVWDSRLRTAMYRWNGIGGSHFRYNVATYSGGHGVGNGRNEIYWDGTLSSDVLGRTQIRYNCYWAGSWQYGITETDVTFNSNVSWETSSAIAGSRKTFEAVALHEFGHALGLSHESYDHATMLGLHPFGGSLGYYNMWDPLADDRAGVRVLYPASSTESDIAASRFKYGSMDTTAYAGSTTSANTGGYAWLEFTVSNLGTSRMDFDVAFYLSQDDVITTSDILLGMNTGAWADPGYTGTFARTLYIPTWVQQGGYWLGFILTPRTPEGSKPNNAQPVRQISIWKR